MSHASRVRDAGIALVAALLSLALTTACKPTQQPQPETLEGEDPFNVIHRAVIEDGKVSDYTTEEIPEEAFSRTPFEREKDEEEVRPRTPEKIHPLLQRWIADRSGSERELVVVNFRDDVRIPRFPEPRMDEPRESPANRGALDRAEELVREIESRRAEAQKRTTDELGERYDARVVETFWLVNAVLVEIPLSALRQLAERDDVVYLEPERTEDEPPQNSNNNDDVDDGRARIVSDPYFNLGLTSGWIGLLDTGMRFTHVQFNSPSHIAFRRDCVNGGASCATTGSSFNPNDDCWNHGTSSAGIITANNNQGNAFRGVTGITLDSWKIYPTSFDGSGLCNGNLNTSATLRAFQRAVAVLDRVIVAEMQSSSNYLGSISTAADNAFDAGALVIAANGNNGPTSGTVNSPANAHRAIGVGNFDVQTQNQIASQSRGPTPDNRFKPDIQTPTNTETASNGCAWRQNCTTAGSDSALRVFGGTSGATPYAAAAAALLRNWVRRVSSGTDPGQIYALLILSGTQAYPFNNTSGAGPLQLPTNGWAWWGKVSVRDGETIDIPLTTPSTSPREFDTALWWPETAVQIIGITIEPHSDIDLHLIDPGGTTRDVSISIPSVFERTRVGGSVPAGTWKLRIRGFNVPGTAQTVYWAAHVRR